MNKRQKQSKTREELLRRRTGFFTFDELVVLFEVSPATVRKYIDMELVWHDGKDGNASLFAVDTAKMCMSILRQYRPEMSLRHIGRNMRLWVQEALKR